jgi:hypothetical protein
MLHTKKAGPNRVDVSVPLCEAPFRAHDLTSISMNVDNFQEAYDFLLGKGFVNPRGDKVTDTSSSKSTMLFAPSGFPITVSEHLKER